MKSLLIVDDEPRILDTVSMAFPDFQVTTCRCAKEGLEAFRKDQPDVVLCDIRLPDMSGLELFESLHAIDNKTPIILMTGQGNSATAIEAMQKGAFEYVLKPLDPDQLIPLIDSAYESNRMMRVPTHLPEDHRHAPVGSDLLIGQCPAMQDVYRAIGRVASQNVTVLILGESGTGKEVIARAIYNYGRRADKKFLVINCAAIPEQLLESELFGHEKGSFTGADRKRIGKFEQCSGGTLFLDEIGDMPPLMQTKILRVLQDQVFERVGGMETVQTDVRVIAATNRDLESMIRIGDFRSDLFYRLNVYTINLPPLRERGHDILQLAEHFLGIYARELGKETTGIAPETGQLLRNYDWPGNVRELQSVVKHALLVATGPVLVPSFLPPPFREMSSNVCSNEMVPRPHLIGVRERDIGTHPTHDTITTDVAHSDLTRQVEPSETIEEMLERHCQNPTNIYESVIDEIERRLVTRILNQCGGNQTEAARRLGVTRTTIRAKIDKLNIEIQKVAE